MANNNQGEAVLFNSHKFTALIKRLVFFFLVAVVTFGLLFWAIGFLPGSGVKSAGNRIPFLDNFYFSFVTITTLGYGDLVPVGYAKLAAAVEAIFGLVYFGYAISQVVSFRQEGLVDYLTNSNIVQTFDECLAEMAEAKEMIGDRRRSLQAKVPINATEFIYFRLNPFYPLFRSIKKTTGYTSHIQGIGKVNDLIERIELASHHIEEAAGFARKLINILNSDGIQWKTDRSVMILTEMCEIIDSFCDRFVIYTRYKNDPYKGGRMYVDVVRDIVDDIRIKISGPTVKYRPNSAQKEKIRRISRFGPGE